MRAWRRLVVAFGVALTAFVAGVILHAPVCWPFDWVWNVGSACYFPEVACPADGKVRVVFLQHGLFRTPMAFDRLERTLKRQGYEVVNSGYPSADDYLEGHAERLHHVVEQRLQAGAVDEISFVGHSMGGLVIHEYLRRPDARTPKACVYLATPQRGAIMADKRRHWFLFKIAMGTKAAAQLATTDVFHAQPIPFGDRSGTVVGDIGDGHDDIPGLDDGTVGAAEATFAGAADSVHVPYGHTSIVVMDEVLGHVAHFLARGGFSGDGKPG